MSTSILATVAPLLAILALGLSIFGFKLSAAQPTIKADLFWVILMVASIFTLSITLNVFFKAYSC